VWNTNVGNQLFTYPCHSGVVNALAWSPDSRRIASASYKAVQVWDATTGDSVFTYQGHHDWVRSVAWSPDGTRIASSGDDKTVQLWVSA
jgi:WD40 repeat protein